MPFKRARLILVAPFWIGHDGRRAGASSIRREVWSRDHTRAEQGRPAPTVSAGAAAHIGAPSSFSPFATIFSAPSGKGR